MDTHARTMTADELVALIDRFGRLQGMHGDAAALAHKDENNMGLGLNALEIEAESTEVRAEWGRAFLELCEADDETSAEGMRAVFEVIDAWAFGLWHAAWHAATTGAVDGGGLEEWKRLEVEPQRALWEAAVRAVVDRAAA
jgi:hypothetical protein